jgi:serine/threonine-protein kinase
MSAMNAPPATGLTREQFLASVRASGVLTDRQFDRLTGALTVFQKSARDVAEFLVTGDWLTRFQAERLLYGKAEGFLLGPYVVQDYLFKSTSGRAYKAKHRTMNRAVAVLVLKPELTATESVREAIRRQARSAARVAHPNVLTLLDVNTAGDRMYLVHEYVDGTDLVAMVRAGGPMCVAKACEFTRQAAVGLQHAHDKQTTHGRLSPTAVLVGRPGGNGPQDKPVVKVCGLGLGEFAGTDQPAEFVAPELNANPTPTVAADLFALGGVLHFLLTGRPPHPAAPPHTLRPDLPAPLLAFVTTLLNANPARRPSTASEVANTLTAFASHSSTLIDFALPSREPPSVGTLSTGTASGLSLPLGIPLSATPPPSPQSPFADLGNDSTENTPVNGQAMSASAQSDGRARNTSRHGTRTRKQEQKLLFWMGVITAAIGLTAAGSALALLAAFVR